MELHARLLLVICVSAFATWTVGGQDVRKVIQQIRAPDLAPGLRPIPAFNRRQRPDFRSASSSQQSSRVFGWSRPEERTLKSDTVSEEPFSPRLRPARHPEPQVVYAPAKGERQKTPLPPVTDAVTSSEVVVQPVEDVQKRQKITIEDIISPVEPSYPVVVDGLAGLDYYIKPEEVGYAELELTTLNDPSVVEIRETIQPPMIQYNEDGSLYAPHGNPLRRGTHASSPHRSPAVGVPRRRKPLVPAPVDVPFRAPGGPLKTPPALFTAPLVRPNSNLKPLYPIVNRRRKRIPPSRRLNKFSSRQGLGNIYRTNQHADFTPSGSSLDFLNSQLAANFAQRKPSEAFDAMNRYHLQSANSNGRIEIGEDDEVVVLRVPEEVLAKRQHTSNPYPMIFTAPSQDQTTEIKRETAEAKRYQGPKQEKDTRPWWSKIPFINRFKQRRAASRESNDYYTSASEVEHSVLPPPSKRVHRDPYLSETAEGEPYYPTYGHAQQAAYESLPDLIKPILNPIKKFVLPDELHNPFRGGYAQHRPGYQYKYRVPYYPAPYYPQMYSKTRPPPPTRFHKKEGTRKSIQVVPDLASAATEYEEVQVVPDQIKARFSQVDPNEISVIDTGDHIAVIQGDINRFIEFQTIQSADDAAVTDEERKVEAPEETATPVRQNKSEDEVSETKLMKKMSLSEALQRHNAGDRPKSRKRRQIASPFRHRRPHRGRPVTRRQDFRTGYPTSADNLRPPGLYPPWESVRYAPRPPNERQRVKQPSRELVRPRPIQEAPAPPPLGDEIHVSNRQRINNRAPPLSLSAPRMTSPSFVAPPNTQELVFEQLPEQYLIEEEAQDDFVPSIQFGFRPVDEATEQQGNYYEPIDERRPTTPSSQEQHHRRPVDISSPENAAKKEVVQQWLQRVVSKNEATPSLQTQSQNGGGITTQLKQTIRFAEPKFEQVKQQIDPSTTTTTLRLNSGHAVLNYPVHEIKSFSKGIVIKPTAQVQLPSFSINAFDAIDPRPIVIPVPSSTQQVRVLVTSGNLPVAVKPTNQIQVAQGTVRFQSARNGDSTKQSLSTNSVNLEESNNIDSNSLSSAELDPYNSINNRPTVVRTSPTTRRKRPGQNSKENPTEELDAGGLNRLTDDVKSSSGAGVRVDRPPVIRKIIRVTKTRLPGQRTRLQSGSTRRQYVRRPHASHHAKNKTPTTNTRRRPVPQHKAESTSAPIVFRSKIRQESVKSETVQTIRPISTTVQPEITTQQDSLNKIKPLKHHGNVHTIRNQERDEYDQSDDVYVNTNADGLDLVAVPSVIQTATHTGYVTTPKAPQARSSTTQRSTAVEDQVSNSQGSLADTFTSSRTTTASSTQDETSAGKQQPSRWTTNRSSPYKKTSKTRHRIPTLPHSASKDETSPHSQLQKYLNKYAEKYGLNLVNTTNQSTRRRAWSGSRPPVTGLRWGHLTQKDTKDESTTKTESGFGTKAAEQGWSPPESFEDTRVSEGSQYSYRFQPPPSTFVRQRPKVSRLAALLSSSNRKSPIRKTVATWPSRYSSVTGKPSSTSTESWTKQSAISTTQQPQVQIWSQPSETTLSTTEQTETVSPIQTTSPTFTPTIEGEQFLNTIPQREDNADQWVSSDDIKSANADLRQGNTEKPIEFNPAATETLSTSVQTTLATSQEPAISESLEPEGQSSLFSVVYTDEKPHQPAKQPEIYTRLTQFLLENGAQPPSTFEVTLGSSQGYKPRSNPPPKPTISKDGALIIQAVSAADTDYGSWIPSVENILVLAPAPAPAPPTISNSADAMLVYPEGVSVPPPARTEDGRKKHDEKIDFSEEVVYYQPRTNRKSDLDNLAALYGSISPVFPTPDNIQSSVEAAVADLSEDLFSSGSETNEVSFRRPFSPSSTTSENPVDSQSTARPVEEEEQKSQEPTEERDAREETIDLCLNGRCSFIYEPGRNVRVQH